MVIIFSLKCKLLIQTVDITGNIDDSPSFLSHLVLECLQTANCCRYCPRVTQPCTVSSAVYLVIQVIVMIRIVDTSSIFGSRSSEIRGMWWISSKNWMFLRQRDEYRLNYSNLISRYRLRLIWIDHSPISKFSNLFKQNDVSVNRKWSKCTFSNTSFWLK